METGSSHLPESSEEAILDHLRTCLKATSTEQAIYLRIASVLSSKVSEGYFETGEWLPSHRSLAKAFDVNLTTVTKSLNYLKDRGIISARAGKGTVVRGRALDYTPPSFDVPDLPPEIDLSVHTQTLASVSHILLEGSKEIIASATSEMDRYFPATGDPQAIETATGWLHSRGFHNRDVHVAVTAGAQHALLVAMAACMQRGDIILAPSLVYQGVKSAAKMLGLGISPVEIDNEGIVPDDLERAIRNTRVKALFIMPNYDNPTAITLSESRKSAIASIAKRHSLILIEDDVYRCLATEELSTIHSRYPEGTFYFSSLSKVITPGCRFGFLAHPPAFSSAVATASRGSIWMPDRFSLALARWLIESGAGEDIIQQSIKSHVKRHSIALKTLGANLSSKNPESNIIWLPLDSRTQASSMKDRLSARGVGVSCSDVFRIGESAHSNGIRIYKSSARNDEEWEIALRTIAQQLHLIGS
ncbi:PLP-dependent aminotransferase family protein [Rhodobacteraceae bacterium KMM 6894]|nr:PLP-dependent aminotransferase family protein [Rhodobacteraceae bacterium KMM 6894]